jgi:hypothetical protein
MNASTALTCAILRDIAIIVGIVVWIVETV